MMGSIVEGLESLHGSATVEVEDDAGFGDVEKVNSWPSLPSSSVGKSTRKKKNNGGVKSTIQSSSSSFPSAASTASAASTRSAGGIAGTVRRIFTPEFKQSVLEAYTSDPECIGNQRATARKFNIHRRQVQKWLTQLDKEGEGSSHPSTFDQGAFNHDGNRSSNNSPTSSVSSCDKEQENSKEKSFQEEFVDQPQSQCDLSLSPESLDYSKPPFDLSTMSSTAMAMSLNLTQTPNTNNVNSLGHLKRPYHANHLFHSELSRNNSSPSPTSMNQQQLIPPAIPSPNSLLSKFYSLYAPSALREQGVIELPKYQLPNLNGDALGKGHLRSGSPIHSKIQQSIPKPRRTNRQRQSNTGINNSYSQHIQILDEIAAAYPHDDFSLLRQAVLRNEVSFTKVSSSTPKSTFFPAAEVSTESNGGNFGRYNGKGGPSSRTSSPTSISPKNNPSQTNNTLAQLLGQVLGPQDLQRQQTEYMRLVQQSGLNIPDLSPDGIEVPNTNNGLPLKYPLLLAQAAATLGLPLLTTPPHINGQKKSPPPPHVFASPKPPTNNSKPKTKNKRKNSKPNQICDFQQDLEDDDLALDVPLDMMIPIKKRRMSSQ